MLAELRRLFLVEDPLTRLLRPDALLPDHVGAWFNGMTLVILCKLTGNRRGWNCCILIDLLSLLAYVALFTPPKVYETNKQSIDAYLDVVRSKINEITEEVSGHEGWKWWFIDWN